MNLIVNDNLSVICFARNGGKAGGGPLFAVREFDSKIIRGRDKGRGRGPSEQAIRASIRQAILNMNLKSEKASKEEIRILKERHILGKRAPSCSLLNAEDMIKLLKAFGREDDADEFAKAVAANKYTDDVPVPSKPVDSEEDEDMDGGGGGGVDASPHASSATPSKMSTPSKSASSAAPSSDSDVMRSGGGSHKKRARATVVSPVIKLDIQRLASSTIKKARQDSPSHGLDALLSALEAMEEPGAKQSSPSSASTISAVSPVPSLEATGDADDQPATRLRVPPTDALSRGISASSEPEQASGQPGSPPEAMATSPSDAGRSLMSPPARSSPSPAMLPRPYRSNPKLKLRPTVLRHRKPISSPTSLPLAGFGRISPTTQGPTSLLSPTSPMTSLRKPSYSPTFAGPGFGLPAQSPSTLAWPSFSHTALLSPSQIGPLFPTTNEPKLDSRSPASPGTQASGWLEADK